MTIKLVPGIALSLLLSLAPQVFAKTTNPVDLVVDGASESLYVGKSDTTQLFLDYDKNGKLIRFWVKVTANPGIHTPSDNGPPPAPQPIKAYIKYFPLDRYLAVLNQLNKIHRFGVVNPYVDGYVICDAPNSTIRLGKKTVIMAYNCGSEGRDADKATFNVESLIKALYTETLQHPDLQGAAPG
jgi:hypothetical protein